MRLGSFVPFEHKKKSLKPVPRSFSRWRHDIGSVIFKICRDLGATFPETQEIKIDVCDDKAHMIIMAELPGVQEQDITLELSKGTLTIHGVKHPQVPPEGHQFYLSERCYGSFSRSFHIPFKFDLTKVQKELANGVLILTIPKKRKQSPA
jgi:HSP20 family protein